MRMVGQHNVVEDVLIKIMMVLWCMTAVPTGILFICHYVSNANEVCVVGLQVG